MGKIVRTLLPLILLVSLSCASFAQEEKLAKEELIDRIEDMLGLGQELLSFLPELKVSYDEEGSVAEALYNREGAWIALDELDEESLRKLYTRVSSERTRIINERTMRQLRREQQRVRQERQMRQLRQEQRRMRQERQLRNLKGQ